jgi:hypothetical protein
LASVQNGLKNGGSIVSAETHQVLVKAVEKRGVDVDWVWQGSAAFPNRTIAFHRSWTFRHQLSADYTTQSVRICFLTGTGRYLVGRAFNSNEKRLARLVPLVANFRKEDKPEPMIAKISQETLECHSAYEPRSDDLDGPLWVILRKARDEHMLSALPPIAAVTRRAGPYVRRQKQTFVSASASASFPNDSSNFPIRKRPLRSTIICAGLGTFDGCALRRLAENAGYLSLPPTASSGRISACRT